MWVAGGGTTSDQVGVEPVGGGSDPSGNYEDNVIPFGALIIPLLDLISDDGR